MKSIELNGAFDEAMYPSIESTLKLIHELHDGQTDHTGKPYVAHPIRVARNVRALAPQSSDDVVMAAMLHDTVEDCGIDEEYLRQRGYSDESIVIVRLVTKPENDFRSYDEVIDDLIASGNKGAMIVKLADNMDNLHPARVADLKETNPIKAERLGDRYRASIDKLCIATGIASKTVHHLISSAPNLKTAETSLS